jgi:hypothetical protein
MQTPPINPETKTVAVKNGEGRYQITLTATLTGNGIIAQLLGGEKPHVGGVVLSVPRPSLTGEGVSCDTWILPVPGHKDVEAARLVAEMICRATQQTTVVAAGIHINKAKNRELEIILNNCLAAAREMIDRSHCPKNN